MNDHKDPFIIPADFINERVVLGAAEVIWGFRNGWLTANGAVRVCVHVWNVLGDVPPVMERIGSLLSDEEEWVSGIAEAVDVSGEWVSFEAEVWSYLAVAYVNDNWDAFDHPHEMIESIFADFEYPEAMRPFIRFMPYDGPGEPPEGYVDSQLAEYVENRNEFYRSRVPVDER